MVVDFISTCLSNNHARNCYTECMVLIKQCGVCGKDFKTKQFYIHKGQGKFCSTACKGVATRNGREYSCHSCGILIYRAQGRLKKSSSGKMFCSRSCQTKWRNQEFIGPKHANWIHGRSAYQSVLRRNRVPEQCSLCKTLDKRVLAVHHIDRNRLNNELQNLVWLCHNCHFLVHHYGAGKAKGY